MINNEGFVYIYLAPNNLQWIWLYWHLSARIWSVHTSWQWICFEC